MSKQKQKEQLPLRIAKITLAIAVITGLGTIIFGGGVVIMKYYKSEADNRIVKTVDQETENYYDVLEKKCNNGCCLSSLNVMRRNNFKKLDENEKCPDGFKMNSLPCPTAFQWCQPIENCLKEGEVKFGTEDECCGKLKLVGDASYISESKVCVSSQLGICLNCGNGICESKENRCNCPEDCGDKSDTSDWQTYRNEEFGFEMKYPKDWNITNKDGYHIVAFNPNSETNILINVQDHNTELSVEESAVSSLEKGMNPPIISKKNEVINNLEMFRLIAWDGNEFEKVFVLKENKLFVFLFAYTIRDSKVKDSIYYNDFNQILSSFKFIEK